MSWEVGRIVPSVEQDSRRRPDGRRSGHLLTHGAARISPPLHAPAIAHALFDMECGLVTPQALPRPATWPRPPTIRRPSLSFRAIDIPRFDPFAVTPKVADVEGQKAPFATGDHGGHDVCIVNLLPRYGHVPTQGRERLRDERPVLQYCGPGATQGLSRPSVGRGGQGAQRRDRGRKWDACSSSVGGVTASDGPASRAWRRTRPSTAPPPSRRHPQGCHVSAPPRSPPARRLGTNTVQARPNGDKSDRIRPSGRQTDARTCKQPRAAMIQPRKPLSYAEVSVYGNRVPGYGNRVPDHPNVQPISFLPRWLPQKRASAAVRLVANCPVVGNAVHGPCLTCV